LQHLSRAYKLKFADCLHHYVYGKECNASKVMQIRSGELHHMCAVGRDKKYVMEFACSLMEHVQAPKQARVQQ